MRNVCSKIYTFHFVIYFSHFIKIMKHNVCSRCPKSCSPDFIQLKQTLSQQHNFVISLLISFPTEYTLIIKNPVKLVCNHYWSSEGRSFVMRILNPCPENFDQNVVVCDHGRRGELPFFSSPNLPFRFPTCQVQDVICISRGRGGGVNYHFIFQSKSTISFFDMIGKRSGRFGLENEMVVPPLPRKYKSHLQLDMIGKRNGSLPPPPPFPHKAPQTTSGKGKEIPESDLRGSEDHF